MHCFADEGTYENIQENIIGVFVDLADNEVLTEVRSPFAQPLALYISIYVYFIVVWSVQVMNSVTHGIGILLCVVGS